MSFNNPVVIGEEEKYEKIWPFIYIVNLGMTRAISNQTHFDVTTLIVVVGGWPLSYFGPRVLRDIVITIDPDVVIASIVIGDWRFLAKLFLRRRPVNETGLTFSASAY